jgi:ABC-2 type transport system ATP-binding protein
MRSKEMQVNSPDALPLEVRGLTKTYRPGWMAAIATRRGPQRRAHTAVDDVSFAVRPGEIYGVIGANGSGKSTLIRVLSTLLLPDRGDVRVFGLDALRHPQAVRPLLNRVSADPSFFRAMSAMENLLFFGRAYGLSGSDARRNSAAILRRLHLGPGHANQPMLHLSRGQQQKVAVARAFLSNPRLMLLDEPTTGLDPRSKRDVQGFVSEVRERNGVTVLLTTHDMDEAELLCDRIGFLSGGCLVAEGTPLELRHQVAAGRPVEDVDMEAVFMHLTGRRVEEDEEEEECVEEDEEEEKRVQEDDKEDEPGVGEDEPWGGEDEPGVGEDEPGVGEDDAVDPAPAPLAPTDASMMEGAPR